MRRAVAKQCSRTYRCSRSPGRGRGEGGVGPKIAVLAQSITPLKKINALLRAPRVHVRPAVALPAAVGVDLQIQVILIEVCFGLKKATLSRWSFLRQPNLFSCILFRFVLQLYSKFCEIHGFPIVTIE